MKAFFDKFKGDGGDDKNKKKQAIKNPFANFGGQPRTFAGQGNSLGGSQPGQIMSITLDHPGPLGMKVERRPNTAGTAIVAMIIPGGQAEQAGLQRGDILCWQGQDEEVTYDEFIQMATSDLRPLTFDIRRIKTKAAPPQTLENGESAEAFQRKQAVIAAAEAREKAAKQWNKPIQKKVKETVVSVNDYTDEPMSEEAKKAIQAAKNGETEWAKQLGYNPYETNKSTAGQARNATVAVKHGNIHAATDNATTTALPNVTPPKQAMQPDLPSVSTSFGEAYATIVTSNSSDRVVNSFGVMCKLILNATTKGQTLDEDTSSKFRRVRLTNEKIQAAITEVHGALDLMMSVGFQLVEADGESYLVYPAGEVTPSWLKVGLSAMEQYETNSKTP